MEIEKPIIGVPVCGDHECFEEMIYSLLVSTRWYNRIIIIESDGDMEFWEKYEEKFEIIHTKKEGPLKAYNKLFEIARQENNDLLITQSDVLFPALYKRDWLQIMYNVSKDKETGLVIPINGGGYSGEDYLNGFPWVGGWCTYFSKKCWELFEGYDNKYPLGYGVDIDCTYLINQKYRTRVINYWVDHHMQNSREHDNNPDAEKARKEAGAYFRSKYGFK